MEQTNVENYLSKMQKLQENLIQFLDLETDLPEDFNNLSQIFKESKICDDKHEFQSFLHLIVKISKNHHRGFCFFSKIDKILLYFKDRITQYFTNSEIFNIFKGNKRILLFFVENQMMKFDERIIITISRGKYKKAKYPQYFQPELQPFMNEKWFPLYFLLPSNIKQLQRDITESFYELRKIGENDDKICEIIRTDSIDQFITYINKNNIPLDAEIIPSIFETNSFLAKKQVEKDQMKLIEYAAFFGSISIFNYLRLNSAKLTQSLWSFAIHGNNPEIIQLNEDNKIDDRDSSYKLYYKESIKCHHNDVADYFLSNFLTNEKVSKILGFKYYNFDFIDDDEMINFLLKGENIPSTFNDFFVSLCKYDYFVLVESILENKAIAIDDNSIYIKIFQ